MSKFTDYENRPTQGHTPMKSPEARHTLEKEATHIDHAARDAKIEEALAELEAELKVAANPQMPVVTVHAAVSKATGNLDKLRAILKG